MAVRILLKTWRGPTEITFSDDENPFETATVADLIERVRRILWVPEAPTETFRLVYTDKILEEDKTLLSAYGIQHMSVVHVVLRLAGGGGATHGMGESAGRNASKEQLSDFDATDTEESSCCII